ncbi:hypothetical protein L6164_037248 [Bauhinia variegata]|uniref:Uncharacterized protein n=1 Tax=Bauhinia variegata TaxID=167791 RepID=A0ACB9KJG6_BAUVA|nr:hypothetical protein L6164_037248 [Bauhinia variegata]
MECVQSVSMKVMWNGAKTEEFKPGRGVRQGDPISPYISVTCMDKLSQLQRGWRKGAGDQCEEGVMTNSSHISCLRMISCFLQKLVNNILIRFNNALTSSAGAQGKKSVMKRLRFIS